MFLIKIKKYIEISKPGIIFGNLFSVAGGFFLASKTKINFFLLINTLIGLTFIIASSCVFNNLIDYDIDKIMQRTKNRVYVKKLISLKSSLLYGITVGNLGFFILYYTSNLLSLFLAILGFFIYVFIYSLYMKRNSEYSMLIGCISGAMPPVIGYCSVTNVFDLGAFLLLIIFILWQIPHFYAITIRYLKDYQKANIPVFEHKKSNMKICMIFYIFLFSIATIMLTIYQYTGYKYLTICSIMNIFWLIVAFRKYKDTNNISFWSYNVFIFSILNIIVFNIMISIDAIKQ